MDNRIGIGGGDDEDERAGREREWIKGKQQWDIKGRLITWTKLLG